MATEQVDAKLSLISFQSQAQLGKYLDSCLLCY